MARQGMEEESKEKEHSWAQSCGTARLHVPVTAANRENYKSEKERERYRADGEGDHCF